MARVLPCHRVSCASVQREANEISSGVQKLELSLELVRKWRRHPPGCLLTFGSQLTRALLSHLSLSCEDAGQPLGFCVL